MAGRAEPPRRTSQEGGAKLDVTLIETNPIYSSSFFSNLYLGGFRQIESLNHGYRACGARHQGRARHATDVDTSGKKVKVGSRSFAYDKLVLSPGIDIKFDSIPGYSREASRSSCRTPTTRRLTASACSSGNWMRCATVASW